MTLTITIIVGVGVAYLVYHYIHQLIVRRATTIVRDDAQATTEAAVSQALQQLAREATLSEGQDHYTVAQTVADVWGRGVMAFEFTIVGDGLTPAQLPMLRRQLNNALGEYAGKHEVARYSADSPTFVVTDLWLFEDQWHVDVAYLMNEATVEYIRDLKRLNASEVPTQEKQD
ncbi:hypothetical protein [Furfurilactobacillus entadae]|uniref:hypothetical protein n=1 Tax=Furfurilactobacillus entadae TaxID=2922307 RepID=UPI0035EBF754